MDQDSARTRLLDAAESLFYGRGIQAVGMDDIRAASGVSLKRLYQLYPAKERLVVAYLERRDTRWRARLAAHVERHDRPDDRLLAVFDWLGAWFAEPDFRGCAWINSYGELGASSATVAEQVRHHKREFHRYLQELVAAAVRPDRLADDMLLLAEGAMVTAGIFGDTAPAARARSAVERLMGESHTG
ncbi:TetR/AcrR family transcriptional regulator [Pseudonocardia sp.]|uniref:TetR/AcrR family transcriptional regulator n=1 Tax=Pseudonocardia sp. TaxID=60912 RepID=UPI00261FE389|nr:TetR/AcrR family transcriptional regulator [Pseudonocardia sp.]